MRVARGPAERRLVGEQLGLHKAAMLDAPHFAQHELRIGGRVSAQVHAQPGGAAEGSLMLETLGLDEPTKPHAPSQGGGEVRILLLLQRGT